MKKVLIVEDDPLNIRVFTKVLDKWGGIESRHTENVTEVLEAAETRAVDLILLDVSLAHSVYKGRTVDGIAISRILKGDPRTAAVPVVLVTAHAMSGDQDHFLRESGADAYVAKPVTDHQEFVAIIHNLIAGS